MKKLSLLLRIMLVGILAVGLCTQCTKNNAPPAEETEDVVQGEAPEAAAEPAEEEDGEEAEESGGSVSFEPLDKVKERLEPGMYAVMDTSMGRIVIELFPDKAPKTVENFVGLAEGTKEWTDPRTGEKSTEPLYDGTIFHRVIPQFMIQGGDPLGQGTGGPGYKFEDEFDPSLKFDKPGLLAMANSGPNTNGSQFFITQVPTPHLNNHHTIFGQVVEGQGVVNSIVGVPRGPNDKPMADVVLEKVTILRLDEASG